MPKPPSTQVKKHGETNEGFCALNIWEEIASSRCVYSSGEFEICLPSVSVVLCRRQGLTGSGGPVVGCGEMEPASPIPQGPQARLPPLEGREQASVPGAMPETSSPAAESHSALPGGASQGFPSEAEITPRQPEASNRANMALAKPKLLAHQVS